MKQEQNQFQCKSFAKPFLCRHTEHLKKKNKTITRVVPFKKVLICIFKVVLSWQLSEDFSMVMYMKMLMYLVLAE